MESAPTMKTSRLIAFDGWVLHADIGELVRDGRKIRLQQLPLLVLEELLARPGELVTREQLIARLWPKGVVDFDTGLNTAVRKLRVALGDVAEVPRYIETIPRKGYRFIAAIDGPVEDVALTPAVAPPAAPTPAPVVDPPASGERRVAERRDGAPASAAPSMRPGAIAPRRGTGLAAALV